MKVAIGRTNEFHPSKLLGQHISVA